MDDAGYFYSKNDFQNKAKMTFKLSEKFLSKYQGQQPNWGYGDLSYFTYKRTYSRLTSEGIQEEFFDTLKRVTEGTFSIQERHCKSNGLPWNAYQAQKTAQTFFQKMWEFKFLPPGRGLWMMGTEIVDKIGSAGLNNCGFVSTKDINIELAAPFAWAMDMLMLGVGIGFDTKGAGNLLLKQPKATKVHYEIPDSREGWVESVRLLLNSYQGRNEVEFSYELIRPFGAPIKGFGGQSSGPQPLIELHDNIRKILDDLIGETITSVAIVDIMNFVGKCVVAGNVRRSAELGIGDINDKEYVEMKDPTKFGEELGDRRWASNNSVFASSNSNFGLVTDNIISNGEPGLIFLDNARHYGRIKDGWIPFESEKYDDVQGFNPCVEQGLENYELCCLVETFPANHDSYEEYLETLKFAYLYSKSVTLIPTHDEKTNAVMMRNRRIGCSMSGIQQAFKKFGHSSFLNDFCDKGYEAIRGWDRVYSRWLGVPRSIKMTTVKPSGTVSILAGATPGIHFTHDEFYYRTVRCSASSSLIQKLRDAKYRIEYSSTDRKLLKKAIKDGGIEDPKNWKQYVNIDSTKSIGATKNSVFEHFANAGGTVVVYFPVKEKNFTKSKFDVSVWEQVLSIREMQHYWSDNGVSCTITFNKDEAKDLERIIEFASPYVKSLSFLPLTDHKYEQAPYQEISEEDYKKYAKSIKSVDFSETNEAKISGSKFCDGDQCEWTPDR
jgi:adenosylcobalamin-dependent ribonucleoside-triphosphate reductase